MTPRPLTVAALASALLLLLSAAPSPVIGAPPPDEIPDFTKGHSIPEGATHDWNLGPTGARGWMFSRKLETSEARQVLVTVVEEGSPADGVLQVGDVILGVAGRRFSFDPRTELGRAIGEAEAGNGTLALVRWRDGRTKKVRIRLPELGAYAPTAPYDCPKSERILENGCAALAARMAAKPDAGNPIERSLNALALLASGKEEYLPLVRHQVEWASEYSDPERHQLHSWWYGPVNHLLAEYVLVTGDRTYFAGLERVTGEIVRGQSAVGSWGHRFVQENGRLAGYGMMNAPGLPLTVSLVLAREAGVEVPGLDEAIERSARLIRFYVGKGSVPYGDHHPWIETHDDNGKNGIAALLFHLLGDVEAATYFSHMSVASHGGERDSGHTGNFFNLLWAIPGVALSGPQATGAWLEEFGWSYDLARRWDGTYVHQGPPQPKPDSYRGWDSTGAYLLAYAMPLRKLALTGRRESVVPSVDEDGARSLIDDGRGWSSRRGIADYAERSGKDLLDGLRSWSPVVRERSAMEVARREGDAVPQLVAMLGEDTPEGRLGACRALRHLGERAAAAVPALRKTLDADDLWLRIQAADALSRIGDAARPAVPDLLTMLSDSADPEDPRRMQQRYLCFALFDRREGLLRGSLDGVDRSLLLDAVRSGLRNEDGRARGTIGAVYRRLSFEEIRPILPAIHRAVVEPAPSGIMFADGIRLAGLDLLARNRIAEGVPLCVTLIEPDRWGCGNRVEKCLESLRRYGGAARSEIPRLRELEEQLAAKGWKPERIAALEIPDLIRAIEEDENPPTLRPLEEGAPARP